MYIVYFYRKYHHSRTCCIDEYKPHGLKRGVSQCYFCPAKKCVEYSDGLRRIEISEKTLEAMKSKKYIEIVKIIKKGV